MSEWSADTKATLRRTLHIPDIAEISSTLQTYSERYELFDAHFPTWSVENKVNWCCSCALAPDWFGEMLSTRINNTMLVSALLITVTTAILFFPPQYEMVDDYAGEQDDPNVNLFLWLTSICNVLFMVSIILGLGMSYCTSSVLLH